MMRKQKQPTLRASVTYTVVADYRERLGKLMALLLRPTDGESANEKATPPSDNTTGSTIGGGDGKEDVP